jgi:hypothetical protein
MNLYKISHEYQEVLNKTFDPETGEVNENAIALLELVEKDVKKKGIAVASYIKNLEAERNAIEEAKKEMALREKRLDDRASYLTDYLKSNMERCGMSEISCPYFVVKIKKCPVSVDVLNEEEIPSDYKKTKSVVSLDKVKLKEEMLAGVIVPGASLKQNLRLEIR